MRTLYNYFQYVLQWSLALFLGQEKAWAFRYKYFYVPSKEVIEFAADLRNTQTSPEFKALLAKDMPRKVQITDQDRQDALNNKELMEDFRISKQAEKLADEQCPVKDALWVAKFTEEYSRLKQGFVLGSN